MIYGIDKPIIIWASGSYYELVQRAIALYNENIDSDVQFDVILVEQFELKEHFYNSIYAVKKGVVGVFQ